MKAPQFLAYRTRDLTPAGRGIMVGTNLLIIVVMFIATYHPLPTHTFLLYLSIWLAVYLSANYVIWKLWLKDRYFPQDKVNRNKEKK